MISKKISTLFFLLPFLLASSVMAAYLPNETPENEAFRVETTLDATGMITSNEGMNWVIATPGSIPTGVLGDSQRISLLDYSDHFRTNGGRVSGNKVFGYDSRNRADPLNNLNTEKLLTYESTSGAHLEGEEGLSLDVSGNFSQATDITRCVFMASPVFVIPAFCTKVTAQSYLKSMNSGQVSTKSTARAVADSIHDPLALSYRIAVRPDSDSSYADGTVKTYLSFGNNEARDSEPGTGNKSGTTATWTDSTTVTGEIKNFLKDFGDPSEFQSGFFTSTGNPEDLRSAPTPTPTPATLVQNLTVTAHFPIVTQGYFEITGPGWSWSGVLEKDVPKTFTNVPAGTYKVDYVNWRADYITVNPGENKVYLFVI